METGTTFNLVDFTVKPKELAAAHGQTAVNIHRITRLGAFPFVIVGGGSQQVHKLYHKDALAFTGGTIKSNMTTGRFKTPFADLTPKRTIRVKRVPNTKLEPAKTYQDRTLNLIFNKMLAIDRKLTTLCQESGIKIQRQQ